MIDACDPDADLDTLRKLIRMNTGKTIKLTREEICGVYDDIQGGKLPLPPLVMNSSKTYLIDKKSPLTSKDYELFFSSTVKRKDLVRLARKAGVKKFENLKKYDLRDAIGKRLSGMNVQEPVKFSRKRILTKKSIVPKDNVGLLNNGGLANESNRLNNGGPTNEPNRLNNGGPTNEPNRLNNGGPTNEPNRFNNVGVKNEPNRFNNVGVKNEPNRLNNGFPKTVKFKPPSFVQASTNSQPSSRISFPKGSMFMKGSKPKFLGGNVAAAPKIVNQGGGNLAPKTVNRGVGNNKVVPNKKTSFFGGFFGGSKPKTKNVGIEPEPNTRVLPNKKNEPVPNRKNRTVPNKKNVVTPNNQVVPNKKTSFFGGFFGGFKPKTKNVGIKPEPNTRVFPNKKNDIVPNRKNRTVPNRKNEPITNKKNEIVPNKKNEPIPNKKNNVTPNNQVVPNNKKNEPIPNKKNNVTPNNQVVPNNKKNEIVPNNKKKKNVIRMGKRRAILNEISKHTNKRITSLKGRAANPFRTAEEYNQIAQNVKKMVNLVASENTFNAGAELNKQLNNEAKRQNRAKKNNGNNFNAGAELNKQLNIEANRQTRNQDEKNFNASAELNKQLNIKGKEINKMNTNKKVREGVEFKLKQVKGLTNTDIEEFMKKWNTSKNKTIFNQARKRGEGRIKGKKVKNERNKPKEENNFNASAAMNQLNLAPKKNSLMKKAKTEVGRFGGRIGKWDPAIKNAKSNATLVNLEKQLNKKIELRKEIQVSKIGPIKKRGHLEKVMQLKNNVGQRRKIFEQQLVNLAQNTKKKELSKYITGLNIPTENKSRYVKQTNKPGANLDLIRRTVNKQVEEKIANASKSLVAGAIGKIQAKENKNIANASKSLVSGAIEQVKKKDEAATKIQAVVRGKKNRNAAMNKKRAEFTELAKKTKTNFSKNIAAMKNMKNAFKLRGRIEGAVLKNKSTENAKALGGKARVNPLFENSFDGGLRLGNNNDNNGEISAAALTPKPPNAPKPNKPSFRAIVQKNKEKRVMNAVKLAGKKVELSRASGPERVKMARNLAPKTQENVKKVANAVKVFNRQSATSVINRLKKLTPVEKTQYKGKIARANTKNDIREIQESAVRVDARKKFEEDEKKEEERKKKANMEAERVRKLSEKKRIREAAEKSAASAKKMLTETDKMKAKAKADKAFNDKLAEKRRLLREREAKSEPKKRKSKKK